MGSITETATAFPGQTGQRPNSVAPLAEMLRLNGYSTAAFGKSHETAAWEVSPSGPTDRWPTRSGLRQVLRLHRRRDEPVGAGASTTDMSRVELPKDPNYHFMTDMTNQAIKWTQCQKSLTPDKPFFIYFAPGATHAPHHVPKEWIAKYKGKFDQGWDKLREETLARQIKLGVVPAGTKLAPKPEAIKDWDKLSADEKKLFARQMEVFAGFGEYADYEIGRLIQAIEDLGQLDNTLIFYIVGDNGASAEGDHERPVQRDDLLQRRARNRRGHPQALRRSGRPEVLSATTPPAGPWPATRRSPGRSRSPAATAAPATRWSSTGPRGSRPRAKCGRSGITSSTSRRPSSKRPACPSRSR